MFSRNLSVPDFVRRFFVSCAQISEALVTPRGHCKTKEDSGILYESLVLFLQAMFFHSPFI